MKIYYLQNENQEIIEDGFEKFNDKCKSMESTKYQIVNGYNGHCSLWTTPRPMSTKQKQTNSKQGRN